MINIVLFGPPGSGKGTQAQNLIEKFNLKQVTVSPALNLLNTRLSLIFIL